jgi:hypothetical protein
MTESAAPGAPEAGQQDGGQQPAAAETETQQPSEQAQDVAKLPDWAQKELKDARNQAARYRTEKNAATEQVSAEQARVAAILKAAGINADGDEVPDPDALAAQLGEHQTELWSAKVELQTIKAADKHGVNPDALTDSVKFWESIGDVQLDDPEFASKVDAAIKDALKANPGLKATTSTAAARSGGEMTGAPPPAKQRPKSLTEALRGALGG